MNNNEQRRRKGEDRRRAPRIKRRDIVKYRIEKLPFGRKREGTSQIRDLSESGLVITTSFPITLEAMIKVNFKLPVLEKKVEFDCRIIACEEIQKNFIYVIRLEFINLTAEQKELLKQFTCLFLNKDKRSKRTLPN